MNQSPARVTAASLLRVALLLCCAFMWSCAMRMAPTELQGHGSRDKAPPGGAAKQAQCPRLAASSSASKKPTVASPSSEKGKPGGTALPPGAPSKTAAVPGAPAAKKDMVEVVLTFDDGPHAGVLAHGKNYTQRVFRTLRNNILQKDIKAVFFIQTHAPARGGARIGRYVIAMLARGGHVVGIHTGSTADHANHRTRAVAAPYDVNGNGVRDAADGSNGLESDMIRAKARIRELTGSVPLYVRPTYGERNNTVLAVYRRQNLKMILWDIVSGDSPSVDAVNLNIDKGMQRCIAAGKKQMVILFHDINFTTAFNLEEYLGNICISARKLGKTVVFPTATERVMQILNARTDQ